MPLIIFSADAFLILAREASTSLIPICAQALKRFSVLTFRETVISY
ncbi:hypothetical protein CSE45_1271 [Citreicella sp. SE45]|nr:hypothetical protein CSE45_1271 [Citreicella sp. SE45]